MRRVIIVTYEGVQTLDATGPAEVFAAALGRAGEKAYQVELASVRGGLLRSSCSARLWTRSLRGLKAGPRDTVLVAGGPDAAVRKAMADRALRAWLQAQARTAERLGSVCSGAFVLGAAGLLDGKRAATHWQACDQLRAMFPATQVDANAIFVRDGRLWTSAGVTTGLDMALAMVEDDLGSATADAIAAGLVLYLRRPGFQSQFSDILVSQGRHAAPLARSVGWIRSHLRDASVEGLARAAGLSIRTLYRRVVEHAGITPAALITRLRVEHARSLLESTDLPAKALAHECGFGSATHVRRAFERELGVGPREYRLLHSRPVRPAGALRQAAARTGSGESRRRPPARRRR